MRRIITFILITPSVLVSCIDNSPPKVPQISAVSCPLESMHVQSVSYNEEKGRYSIFHTYAKGGEKIKNPLLVENIQMAQISMPQGEKNDFARLKFDKSNGSCEPILEMTQGFKIELAAAPKIVNGTGDGNNAAHSTASGGSSWAPFLMGALVGNAVSSAMQPRTAPAYYLPPPAGAAGPNGVVTGGVSAKTPDELNKKYESTYNKPAKKGFFSKKSEASNDANKKGFFSRKKNDSYSNNNPPKKRSFFSGSRGSGGSRRR